MRETRLPAGFRRLSSLPQTEAETRRNADDLLLGSDLAQMVLHASADFRGIQLGPDLRPADLQRAILSEGYCAVRAGLRDDGARGSPLGEEIRSVLAGDGLAGAAQDRKPRLSAFHREMVDEICCYLMRRCGIR